MSLNTLRRLARSIAFKLLLLYFILFVSSSVAFYVISFAVLYRTADIQENEIVHEELRQLRAKSEGQSVEELKALCQREIAALGSDDLLIRIHDHGRDSYLPTAGHWSDYFEDLPEQFERMEVVEWVQVVKSDTDDSVLKLGTIQDSAGRIIQVGFRSRVREELIGQSVRVFPIVAVPILLIGLTVGLIMSRKALSGITRVRQTAMAIYEGNLDRRVEVKACGDEIEQLSETFNLMLGRIQTLIRHMRNMLDNVAHDLRTPLARLRGMAEVALAQDRSPEEYRRTLEHFLVEYDQIVVMISAILNLSDAEAGTMLLRKSEVDLPRLLVSVCDFYRPLAEANDVLLELSLAEAVLVQADLERLRQVFLNLLDNALKFAPAGGAITVSIRREGDKVAVAVANSGAGIAEDDLPNIFQPFFRSDKSRSRKGYGLGLSLVKAIVERHGGQVEVSSRPGDGAVFTVLLPA